MNRFVVYILLCKDQSLYTGYTTDLSRRLLQHELGTGAKYTRGRGPFQVLFHEEFAEKSLAMKRESEIKKLTKSQKWQLIKQRGVPADVDSI